MCLSLDGIEAALKKRQGSCTARREAYIVNICAQPMSACGGEPVPEKKFA